jgi:hypothetical protein
MVSRLSFGNEVAIKSKPLALIRRVAPYVGDRLRGIGFGRLKATSDERSSFFESPFDRRVHHLTKSRAHPDSMGTERPEAKPEPVAPAGPCLGGHQEVTRGLRPSRRNRFLRLSATERRERVMEEILFLGSNWARSTR